MWSVPTWLSVPTHGSKSHHLPHHHQPVPRSHQVCCSYLTLTLLGSFTTYWVLIPGQKASLQMLPCLWTTVIFGKKNTSLCVCISDSLYKLCRVSCLTEWTGGTHTTWAPYSFGPDGFVEPGVDAHIRSSHLLHGKFTDFFECPRGTLLKTPEIQT